jgi:hypothetical protein
MKHTLLTLLSLIFLNSTGMTQSWEGKITYQNSYSSTNDHVTTQQLSSMMGTVQEYYIKGSDYKTVMNGKMMEWQLYVHADNKLYTKSAMSPGIMWNNAAEQNDSLIGIRINKQAATILGYVCDEMVITLKSGVQKYYYSAKIAVDPAPFKNHAYGNWYDYISRAKALPLKMVIETPDFTMQSVAVKVEAQKLDAAIFKLPEGANLVKSPY